MTDEDLSESQWENIQKRTQDFSELLNNIESLDDKKRRLWLEIYQNAITDRQHAYAMFLELTAIVKGKSTEHAVHGKTIATYIERMSRANDQLIKLAELVAKADRPNDVGPEELFDRIKN